MKINAEKASVLEWLALLKEASRGKRYQLLWKRVHQLVEVPARKRPSVNLYKISRHTKEGDNVIVPGKVLSLGTLSHKVNIAAVEFSSPAKRSLETAGCRIVDLKDMIKAEKIHVIV